MKRNFFDVLKWKFGGYDNPHEKVVIPEGFSFPKPVDDFAPKNPSATWLGHDTFIIRHKEKTFLTDPILSERCSPVQFLGPKRNHPSPISFADFPHIDFTLISHNHYDHLDLKSVQTLNQLYPNMIWVVPTGVKAWFTAQKITNVYELGWWNEAPIFDDVKVTAVPAKHFSGRTPFDLNKSLWAGFVVEFKGGKTLYFVGDTGYHDSYFKEIGAKWPSIDLSLIPIGAYMPRRFMAPVHVDPYEAVVIHREVKSKLSIGMHFGTFNLTDESSDLPPYELFLALAKEGISHEKFRVLKPGHAINW